MQTKVCRAKLDREEMRLPNMYGESLYNTIMQFTACTCWRLGESHIRELNLIVFALVYIVSLTRTAKEFRNTKLPANMCM